MLEFVATAFARLLALTLTGDIELAALLRPKPKEAQATTLLDVLAADVRDLNWFATQDFDLLSAVLLFFLAVTGIITSLLALMIYIINIILRQPIPKIHIFLITPRYI